MKGFHFGKGGSVLSFIALYMETAEQNPQQVSTFVVFLL